MVCMKCGHTIPKSNRFCPFCGTPVPTLSNSPAGLVRPASSNTSTKKKVTFQTTPQNIFALMGALVCLLSTFLPFMSTSSIGTNYSVSLFDTVTQVGMDLALWFLFFSVVAIIVLQFLRFPPFISPILAILCLVLLMMEVATAHDTMQSYALSGITISYSYGFYLMILSLLVVVLSGPIKNWKSRH